MAATIRLQRTGRKKQASFRIVVMDVNESPTGPAVQTLGTYNPRTRPSVVELDAASALDWLHEGAQATHTVRSILKKTGVWQQYQSGVTSESMEQRVVVLGPPEGERKTSRRSAVSQAATVIAAENRVTQAAEAAAEAAAVEEAAEAEVAEETPEAEVEAEEAPEAEVAEEAPEAEAADEEK